MLSLLNPPRMEDGKFCNLVANQVRRAACQVLLKGMRSLRSGSISEVSSCQLSFNEAICHSKSNKLSETSVDKHEVSAQQQHLRAQQLSADRCSRQHLNLLLTA